MSQLTHEKSQASMQLFNTLAAAVLVDTLGGLQYLYSSVILSPIKDDFKMDQATIDQVRVFSFVMMMLMMPPSPKGC